MDGNCVLRAAPKRSRSSGRVRGLKARRKQGLESSYPPWRALTIRSTSLGRLDVPRLQFGRNLSQRQALGLEQQRGVIKQISRLADDRLVIPRDGRQCQLHAFFADLLSDARQTRLDQ